ncbi:MAG TPA: hypothetical protein VH583_06600 [Vicinamibacterales bacterium]|jgi:hypothetical protein
MIQILAAAIIAAALLFAARLLQRALLDMRDDRRRQRQLTLMQTFIPALEAGQRDPRAFLVWQPLADAARALLPEEFAAIDAARGARFPFSAEALLAAHAQWTADWLAWERAHDADYKRKASDAEAALHAADAAVRRSKLEAIQNEKLDLYQRHYEEYVRVARQLHDLAQRDTSAAVRF